MYQCDILVYVYLLMTNQGTDRKDVGSEGLKMMPLPCVCHVVVGP